MTTTVSDNSDIATVATMVLNPASSRSTSEIFLMTPRSNFTSCLVWTAFTIAFGSGMMFGYHMGLLNNPACVMQEHFNQSFYNHYDQYLDSHNMYIFWSSCVAALPLGAIVGALGVNKCSQNLGRRQILMINNLIGMLGSLLQLWASVSSFVEAFVAGRVITGLYVGVLVTVGPIYLNEIAPVAIRGSIGSAFPLWLAVGLFVGPVLGLPQCLGTLRLFPYLFVFSFIVCFLNLAMLHFCPESPKFLLLFKSDPFGAMESLRRLRNCYDVSEDLAEIDDECLENSTASVNQNSPRELLTFKQILCDRNLRKVLIIGLLLHLSSSLTGINVLVFYTSFIMETVLNSKTYTSIAVCAVFATMTPFTIVSAALVDKFGRRKLFIPGSVGCGLCLLALMGALHFGDQCTPGSIPLTTKLVLAASLVSFMFAFSVGPGSLPFVIIPELSPTNARSVMTGVTGCFTLLLTLLVSLGYPLVRTFIGHKVFLVFIVGSFLIAIVLYMVVPETRGKTTDEIVESVEGSWIIFPAFCVQTTTTNLRSYQQNQLSQSSDELNSTSTSLNPIF